jgi:hypothetical protein
VLTLLAAPLYREDSQLSPIGEQNNQSFEAIFSNERHIDKTTRKWLWPPSEGEARPALLDKIRLTQDSDHIKESLSSKVIVLLPSVVVEHTSLFDLGEIYQLLSRVREGLSIKVGRAGSF